MRVQHRASSSFSQVSSSLLSELAGFAETVSFRSAMARHTAGDALEHFVKFGQRLEGPVNTTTASMALQELQAWIRIECCDAPCAMLSR